MSPRGHPTPVAVRAALADAIEAAGAADGVDAGPLRDAAAALASPWRVAVVGRTSSGKSTLVARLTGAPRPVGLGGVTDEIAEIHAGDGVVVIDTPGIDEPNAAVVTLGPALERVDAVVWVVDGLQPMTASERDVLRDVLAPDTLTAVVVSKLDLVDADEHEAVLGRTAELAARVGAIDVRGADLRRCSPEQAAAAARVAWPVWPAPRRIRAVREAGAHLRAALAASPGPVGPDELEAELRERVRDAVRRIDERIVAGTVDDAHDAELRLRREIEAWLAAGSRRGGPRLAPPEVAPRSRLVQVKHELAGAEGARRALKAAAARWLQEAQWVVRDGWAGAEGARAASEARRRLERALDALDRAVL